MDEEELRQQFDELTTLELVRLYLERLAEDIPEPDHRGGTLAAMALLGQRAKSLYANFHYSLGSPADFAPVLAVRPLVELVILTKWISLDPELHTFLHVADSDASEMSHLTAIREHAKARGSGIAVNPNDPTPTMKANRDAALAKLKELGRNYGEGNILPNVRRMAAEVSNKVPGHKVVIDDAYIYAYKTFSPWEHTEASSFKATGKETAPGEWKWIGDKSPFHPEDIEALAAAMYAYVLETVFATVGEPTLAVYARMGRAHIITNYVRSDRVQPPGDKPEVSAEP